MTACAARGLSDTLSATAGGEGGERRARRSGAALDDFLHSYNYHRCHTALGGQPPINRVNNAAGQYN